MGMFGGIEKAETSKGGVYLLPGNYLLGLRAAKAGRSRNNVDFFVAELEILASDNEERKVGSKVSWMSMKNNDAFLGNVKAFAAAAFGIPEEKVTEKKIEELISDDQPREGTQIKAQAQNVKTRAGKDFTKVFWEYAD